MDIFEILGKIEELTEDEKRFLRAYSHVDEGNLHKYMIKANIQKCRNFVKRGLMKKVIYGEKKNIVYVVIDEVIFHLD
jgi:hypothetical protein